MTAQPSDNVAHALAGAGGGLLSMTLTYPLITLSTRAQVESRRTTAPLLTTIRQIVAREGLSGLFAGLDSALFGITVTNFVYYYWYEWTRTFFEKAAIRAGRAAGKLTTLETIMAGALAGSATVLLTNPIWVVNTRMTARKQDVEAKDGTEAEPAVKRPTTVGTLIQLLKAGGPAALFAGVIPALVLVINPILQYTIFEKLSQLLLRHRLNKLAAVGSIASASIPARITPRDAFYLGALGKVVATSVTYPYLTVKSRMHVADKDDKKESMFSSLRRIVDEEGYTGLYKGIGPKMAQSVITAAFLFAFKDALYDASLKLRQNGTLKGAIGKVVEKGAAVASATA